MRSRLLLLATTAILPACVDEMPATREHVAASSVNGQLLWEDVVAGTVASSAADLVIHGGSVSVVGQGGTATSTDMLIKTYNADTGAVVWQDAYDRAGRYDVGAGAEAGGGRVYASGAATSATNNRDTLLRAYDAATGALLWSDVRDYAGRRDELSGETIAEDRGLVAVGGLAVSPVLSAEWLVRVHRGETGELLWQDVFDGGDFDHAVSMAAHAGRVFAGGVTTDDNIVRHFTVRAYDARTGALLWQDRQPGMTGYFFVTDVAWRLIATDNQLIAAGSVGNDDGIMHLAVRAYDAATGRLLWSDVFDGGAGADVAFAAASSGNRVFVGDTGGPGCSAFESSNCDYVVRAYDANTGAFLWETDTDFAGYDDQIFAMDAGDDRVAVIGSGFTADFALDWMIQVLDANTGAVLFQDHVPSSGGYGYGSVIEMRGNRMYAAGNFYDADFLLNWRVRAYDLH